MHRPTTPGTDSVLTPAHDILAALDKPVPVPGYRRLERLPCAPSRQRGSFATRTGYLTLLRAHLLRPHLLGALLQLRHRTGCRGGGFEVEVGWPAALAASSQPVTTLIRRDRDHRPDAALAQVGADCAGRTGLVRLDLVRSGAGPSSSPGNAQACHDIG